jgi:diguanylate cyclase (GGDEF)-like protein
MTDRQAKSQHVAEQFKTLFAQMQKLAQEADHQELIAQIHSDAQLTHLQRHIFQELLYDQPSPSSTLRDELTGLLIRSSLLESLDLALKGLQGSNAILAVCFIDLDGFKEINDQHGHALADQALSLVSARLQNSIRSDDLLCRWGGDEFVVVLQNIDRPESVENLANRLLTAISHPLRLSADEPLTLFLGASIGVSIVMPSTSIASQEKVDALTFIERADQAMYNAKKAGKNRIEITTA